MGTKKCIENGIKKLSAKNKINLLRLTQFISTTIRNTSGSFCYEIHNRLSIDNIIPDVGCEVLSNEKHMSDIKACSDRIKVRILYPSGTAWNCIGSLYDELIKDDKYQVCVLTENYPKYINIMAKIKCSFITLDEYSLIDDKPDVLIVTSYSSTDKRINFPDARKYAKYIISLFPNVVINETDMDLHWRYVSSAYKYLDPDYYLFDALPFKFSKGYIEGDKAIRIGNPQFDELYNRLNSAKSSYQGWEKLEGKKVFLWATDHGLSEYHAIYALTFDLYIKEFLEYFRKNEDLGLIIRPHPYLLREIRQSGIFWSNDDYQKLIDYCNSTPNIVWDDSPDYCQSFVACDAMFVDVNCGFTISFLSTGKPICRLKRTDVDTALIHPELADCYDFAEGFDDCVNFINKILSGNDDRKELRENAFTDSVCNFDGKNGTRIKKFIDDMLK